MEVLDYFPAEVNSDHPLSKKKESFSVKSFGKDNRSVLKVMWDHIHVCRLSDCRYILCLEDSNKAAIYKNITDTVEEIR